MITLVSLLLATAAATSGADAVTACRAAHASDPPAHIACLERALRGGQTPQSANSSTSPASPTTAPKLALGEEQIDRGKNIPRPDPVNVEIVSVHNDARGHQVFTMADGQVWRETELMPDNRKLRPGVYKARIERGSIRGYRMYVDGVRRLFKVERIK